MAFIIFNNLNQPQNIGDATLPVDGQMRLETIGERENKLAERGLITICTIAAEPPQTTETVFAPTPDAKSEIDKIASQLKGIDFKGTDKTNKEQNK